ncbi:unnamed protein product [Leptosia nina]|uniref:Uncharacterized protein n=1 Tax=Leptosia nina TaxID=320188 RepID=A0AAV1K0W3_9NEOP
MISRSKNQPLIQKQEYSHEQYRINLSSTLIKLSINCNTALAFATAIRRTLAKIANYRSPRRDQRIVLDRVYDGSYAAQIYRGPCHLPAATLAVEAVRGYLTFDGWNRVEFTKTSLGCEVDSRRQPIRRPP